MKRIVLLFRQETPAIDRIAQRLRGHFGEKRVAVALERLGAVDADDVVVALLSATAGSGGGLSLDEPDRLAASGLDAAFARDGIVVPLLLDGAVMPPYQSLPDSVHKLAYRHALPARCDEQLNRDLGRLIGDLEVHLQCFPAKVIPWDYWLLPVALVGTALSAAFVVLWLIDLWLWDYAYLTVKRYREARFWLTDLGPGILGAMVLFTSWALHLRNRRRLIRRRAENYLSGSDEVDPPRGDPAVNVALVLAVVSLGWGWWASVPSLLAAAWAAIRSAAGHRRSVAWRKLAIAATLAVLASLWVLWRGFVIGRFETALGEYEQGIAAIQANRLPEAKRHFEATIRVFPSYGNGYQGLGLVYARQNDLEAAYRELSRAIARYPTYPRSLFDPPRDAVAAAFRSRAAVADQLGRTAQAEQDRQTASHLTPFIDIFSGMFRFW